MKFFVFVYGTLKRGKRANFLLSRGKFVGDGVVKGYEMYIVRDYPGIVKGKGKVRGEVYEVDAETLKKLDEYEGVPLYYERIEDIVELEKGRKVKAYLYLYKGDVKGLKKAELNEKREYEF